MDVHSSFLNSVKFTVVFYKLTTLHNSAPQIMHSKLYEIPMHTCLTGSFSTCTIYDPMFNTPSFNVLSSNFIMGIYHYGPILTLSYKIYFNAGKISIDRKGDSVIMSLGFLFYGYTCIDGFYFDQPN